MAHIPDREVRSILTRERIAEIRPYLPDGCFTKQGRIFCFEYENSSRGLLYHAAKYMKIATLNPDRQFRLILIRSQTHQEQHGQDYDLARFVLNNRPPNLKYKIYRCQGPTWLARLFSRYVSKRD